MQEGRGPDLAADVLQESCLRQHQWDGITHPVLALQWEWLMLRGGLRTMAGGVSAARTAGVGVLPAELAIMHS